MAATIKERAPSTSLKPATIPDAEPGSNRRREKLVGALFIVATAASILGSIAVGSALDRPDYLTTLNVHEGQVIVAAVLFLIAAMSAFAIAFLLFPVLKTRDEGLAAGYLGLRAFENVFYVASVVALLAMLRVSQSDVVGSSEGSSVPLLGSALLALREWSTVLGTLVFAGLGAVILNDVLYRWRLVPRWLSLWGVLGGAMLVLYGLLGIFGLDTDLGSPAMLLAMPIAVQEMALAGWLLAKGLRTTETGSTPSRG
jgi:hypothetical protein